MNKDSNKGINVKFNEYLNENKFSWKFFIFASIVSLSMIFSYKNKYLLYFGSLSYLYLISLRDESRIKNSYLYLILGTILCFSIYLKLNDKLFYIGFILYIIVETIFTIIETDPSFETIMILIFFSFLTLGEAGEQFKSKYSYISSYLFVIAWIIYLIVNSTVKVK